MILIAEDGGYFDEYTDASNMRRRCLGKIQWVNNHAHVLKAKNHCHNQGIPLLFFSS